MTSKQLYEDVLIELRKENAPNILLEDFNYLANKAIYQYINKRYNIYDVNQQTTDDLRVLKSKATLIPIKVADDEYGGLTTIGDSHMATYYVDLPDDYLHLLNCIVIYKVKKTYKCYDKDDTWRAAATRLTADAYSQVLDNYWTQPTYKRPYYYIHNINPNKNLYKPNLPTNPYDKNTNPHGTDLLPKDSGENTENNGIIIQGNGNPRTIKIGNIDASTIERGQGLRYGNVSKVRLEIRYGTDNRVFSLGEPGDQDKDKGRIYIDYIKTPQTIRLTQKEVDSTEDISLVLEFPDYVCQEIINELVHIIMENIQDQRLQTHPVVSLSIANPAQALTPQAALGQAAQ